MGGRGSNARTLQNFERERVRKSKSTKIKRTGKRREKRLLTRPGNLTGKDI